MSRSQFKYFCFILYPQEDLGHGKVFQYLLSHRTLFDTVYIEHQPEPLTLEEVEEGHNERKAHTHVMVRTKKAMTVAGFQKFFNPYLKHVETVSSYFSYLVYMVHGTLDSENKIQYPVSALQGCQEIIRSVFGDSDDLNLSHLAFFAEKAERGSTLSKIIQDIHHISDEQERKDTYRFFKENQYIITALTQEYRSVQTLIYRNRI